MRDGVLPMRPPFEKFFCLDLLGKQIASLKLLDFSGVDQKVQVSLVGILNLL
jgi:hypothetical protein